MQNTVVDVINQHLIEGVTGVLLAFSPLESSDSSAIAVLVPDMSEESTYKHSDLETVIEKLLDAYEADDVLCAFIHGKTVKSVKFYIGKFVSSFESCIEEHRNTVHQDHKIVILGTTETFKFEGDKVVYAGNKL